MDSSFEFLMSTQGFDMGLDLLPIHPVGAVGAECEDNAVLPAVSEIMEDPPLVLDFSSDADVGPTDDSVFNQTLTFIDFVKDM